MDIYKDDPGAGAARDQVWATMKERREMMDTVAGSSNSQISRLLRTERLHTQVYRSLCQIALTELNLIKKDIGLEDEDLSPGYRKVNELHDGTIENGDPAREAMQIIHVLLREAIEESKAARSSDHFAQQVADGFQGRLSEETKTLRDVNSSSPIVTELERWLWLSEEPGRFGRAVNIILGWVAEGRDSWEITELVNILKKEEDRDNG